jgi:hypothetical protein
MSFMTLLSNVNNEHAGKTFYGDGRKKSAPTATYYIPNQVWINDFDEMADILRKQASSFALSSYVIRAQPTEDTLKAIKDGRKVRRLLHDREDRKATFEDTPVNYVCVDSDDLTYPENLSKKDAVRWVIHQLPEVFHTASCFYQFSSSAFVNQSEKTIKLHLWFWLEKAITTAQLREWFKREIAQGRLSKKVVDLQALRATQPLYIAPPKFEGLNDPLTPDERSSIIRGDVDSVTLPIGAFAPVKEQRKVARTKQAKTALNPQSFIYKGHQSGYADQDCRHRVQKRISELESTTEDRYNQLFKAGIYLGGLVGAARLDIQLAQTLLESAAHVNGAFLKHGEKALEQIMRGLYTGSLRPLFKSDNKAPSELAPFAKATREKRQKPSTAAEITESTLQAVRKGIDEAAENKLVLLKVPTGAGKTYQALKVLLELNKTGRTVIFTSPTYEAINAVRDTLSVLDETVDTLLLKGQKQRCQSYIQTSGEERHELDEILEDRRVTDLCYSINGGRRCPFFDDCELRKEKEQEPLKGRFILAVHQMLGHLKDLPEDSLIVIDESPNFVEKSSVELRSIKALVPNKKELEKWSAQPANDCRSQVVEQADLFPELLPKESTHRPGMNFSVIEHKTPSEKWRYENRETISPFASAISWVITKAHQIQVEGSVRLNKRLIEHLSQDRFDSLKQLAKAALKRIESKESTPELLKVREMFIQSGLELDSYKSLLVKRSAVSMLKQLAELCLSNDESLWVSSNERGHLSISKRYNLKLPTAPIVVLDATAQVESWKRVSLREVQVISAEIIIKQREGFHIKYRGLQSPQLWLNSEKTELTPQAFYSFDRVAELLKVPLERLECGAPIGIGCSKPLRKLIDEGLQGQGPLAKTSLINVLKRYQCITGHTGLDHAYTNKYSVAKVQAMILLGGQYPHYGEERADCEHLGASENQIKTMLRERNESNMVQWHGRPRGLRRQAEEIIHLEVSPMATPIDWIDWHSIEIRGRAETDELKQAIKIAQSTISAKGEVRVSDLTSQGVNPSRARRAFAKLELQSEVDMNYQGHGRPPLVYKPYINHGLNIKSENFSYISLSDEDILTAAEKVFLNHDLNIKSEMLQLYYPTPSYSPALHTSCKLCPMLRGELLKLERREPFLINTNEAQYVMFFGAEKGADNNIYIYKNSDLMLRSCNQKGNWEKYEDSAKQGVTA